MEIKEKYEKFLAENNSEPKFCNCDVRFLEDDATMDATIKLSCDVIDSEDDFIFYYCNGLNDILSLTEKGIEDFVIIPDSVEFSNDF